VLLDVLARLVHVDSSISALPRLLTQIAALALSCGDADRAATYAREALLVMPEAPSATRCQALRQLGTALIGQGQTVTGLALLEEASMMAAQANTPDVGASALCHAGLYALNHGDYLGAERRFRSAIELLSSDGRRRHLLAFAHHNLAVALLQQDHPDAERHVATALALRPDPDSHLAEQDRLLLAKLRVLHRHRAESGRRGDGAALDDRLVSDAEPQPLASETNM
jgi:ATP/maltotriose-dependent transcriptional regulator MalT